MRFHRPVMDERKFLLLAERFQNDFPYLADENRTPEKVWARIYSWFSGDPVCGKHEVFEYDDFCGLLIFKDIVPHHKCEMTFIVIDPKDYGRDLAREAKTVMDMVADAYDLRKIESVTPNPKIRRLDERLGWVCEGVLKDSFMFGGKLYDNYLMAYWPACRVEGET